MTRDDGSGAPPGPEPLVAGAEPGLPARIRAFLAAHSTLVLSTAGPDGPWAAPVFYALADDGQGLGLVFVSKATSRHARDLEATGRAAAAVNAQHDSWRTICGIQLEGTVVALDGEPRLEALTTLVERFPWLSDMATSSDDQERRIAARLAASAIYRLTPTRIVLVDNARGFGSREELEPGEGRAGDGAATAG